MSTLKTKPFTLFSDAGVEKEPRRLRFDFNALADFEQTNGMGLGLLLTMKAVFGTARAMLWVGCKWDDPRLTLQKAGELVGEYIGKGGSVDQVLGVCFEAATDQGALGTPVVKEEEGDDDDSGNGPAPKVLEVASKRGGNSSKKPNP